MYSTKKAVEISIPEVAELEIVSKVLSRQSPRITVSPKTVSLPVEVQNVDPALGVKQEISAVAETVPVTTTSAASHRTPKAPLRRKGSLKYKQPAMAAHPVQNAENGESVGNREVCFDTAEKLVRTAAVHQLIDWTPPQLLKSGSTSHTARHNKEHHQDDSVSVSNSSTVVETNNSRILNSSIHTSNIGKIHNKRSTNNTFLFNLTVVLSILSLYVTVCYMGSRDDNITTPTVVNVHRTTAPSAESTASRSAEESAFDAYTASSRHSVSSDQLSHLTPSTVYATKKSNFGE